MHMTAATAVEEDSLLMTLYLMEEGDQTIHLGSHYIGHDLSSQGLKMELFFFVCCTCNTLCCFIYLAKHMKCSVKLLLIYKCICNCYFYLFLIGIWVYDWFWRNFQNTPRSVQMLILLNDLHTYVQLKFVKEK